MKSDVGAHDIGMTGSKVLADRAGRNSAISSSSQSLPSAQQFKISIDQIDGFSSGKFSNSGDLQDLELDELLYTRKTWTDRLNVSRSSSQEAMVRTGETAKSSVIVRHQKYLFYSPSNTDYTLVRFIFQNDRTSVAVVRQEKSGMYFAAKVAKKSFMNEVSETRFRREYELMSMMNHPNLVGLEEVVENDEEICIIQEYCSGGDLVQFVERSPDRCLPESMVQFIAWEVAKCLLELHIAGVAHRDIKAENVFLRVRPGAQVVNPQEPTWGEMLNFRQNFDVVVGDFGFSTHFATESVMKESVGTLYYASPEIVTYDRKYFGPEVDIWSLGILIYVLLCGRFPFRGGSDEETKTLIRAGRPRANNRVSPLVNNLLLDHCLKVVRSERSNIVDIMLHPFFESLRLEDVGLVESIRSRAFTCLPIHPDPIMPAAASSSEDESDSGEVQARPGHRSRIVSIRRKLMMLIPGYTNSGSRRNSRPNSPRRPNNRSDGGTSSGNESDSSPKTSPRVLIPQQQSHGSYAPNSPRRVRENFEASSPLSYSQGTSSSSGSPNLTGVQVRLNKMRSRSNRSRNQQSPSSYEVDISLLPFLQSSQMRDGASEMITDDEDPILNSQRTRARTEEASSRQPISFVME